MGQSTAEELRALRARAYGPDADIDRDPAARLRLAELEASARAEMRGATGARPAPASGPAARHAADETSDDLADDAGDNPAGDAPDPARASDSAPAPAAQPAPAEPAATAIRPLTRLFTAPGLGLLWVVSLVAAALVSSGVTLVISQQDPRLVTTLAAMPDAPWPEQFPGSNYGGAEVFEPFEGLTMVSMPWGVDGPRRDAMCLYMVGTTPLQPTMMCSVGSFPATTVIPVDRTAPEGLRARFALGTALQFVLQGDRVLVYALGP